MFFALFLSAAAYSQLEVKEGSFKTVDGFVNINLNIQTDDNEVPYAVVKVKTENINDKQRRELLFQGDAATFIECEYKVGEVWVYITYKATYLKISHPDLSSTEFWFPFDMEPKKGYELTLVNKSESNINEERLKTKIEELEAINKEMSEKQPEVRYVEVEKEQELKGIFTFLTLNAAITQYGDLSYGLTIGNYRKFGWFFSAMTNFNFNAFSTDYECGNDLLVGTYYPDYTGKDVFSALSVTGGLIYKVVHPVALRLGVGYGVRNTAYELGGGELVKNTDISASGVEVSLGAMMRFGKFIVSVDAVSTNFKVFEAKIGLGFGVLR